MPGPFRLHHPIRAISRASLCPSPAILSSASIPLVLGVHKLWFHTSGFMWSFCVPCAYMVVRHPEPHFDQELLSLNLSCFLTLRTFALPLPGPFILVLCLSPALHSLFNPVAQRSLSGCQPHPPVIIRSPSFSDTLFSRDPFLGSSAEGVGCSNACGCLNFSLSFFPVVMLLGVTLLKKKYPMAKYLCVLLIVAGVALFMYKPKKVVGMEEHTVGYGELLLVRDPGGRGSLSQGSSPRSNPPLWQAKASYTTRGRLCHSLPPFLVFVSCCMARGSAQATVGSLTCVIAAQLS